MVSLAVPLLSPFLAMAAPPLNPVLAVVTVG
jgi:hypothetical protein